MGIIIMCGIFSFVCSASLSLSSCSVLLHVCMCACVRACVYLCVDVLKQFLKFAH